MAVNRLAQLKETADAAEANGWTYVGNSTFRRMTEHLTPQRAIDNGWWTDSTYTACEFLAFVLRGVNRVPKVVYGTTPCPWVGLSDCSISFKRALDLFAQPLAESEIHDR